MPLFLCFKEQVCTVLCLQGHFSLPSGANGRGLEVCIVLQHFGYGRRPSQFNIIFLKFIATVKQCKHQPLGIVFSRHESLGIVFSRHESAENDAKWLMFALFDCGLNNMREWFGRCCMLGEPTSSEGRPDDRTHQPLWKNISCSQNMTSCRSMWVDDSK
jgi:hypothetical protein